MRLRPVLLSGMVLGTLLGSAAMQPGFAQDNRGFLDRLFNRSGEAQTAKPLFLDKGGQGNRSAQPFTDYNARTPSRSNSSDGADWSEYMAYFADLDRKVARGIAQTQAQTKQMEDAINRKRLAEEANRSDRKAGGAQSSNAKQAYDPIKVYQYSPGNRGRAEETAEQGEVEQRPRGRIFNTR